MADLSDTIATSALDPAVAEVDGQHVEARSIDELVKADQYLAARAAVRRRDRGIMFTRLIPSGPVSDSAATRQGGFGSGGTV